MPQLLDTQGHATHFAQSLALNRLFPDSPTIVFCLPQSGSTFQMCRRTGRCCCLFWLPASGRTLERPTGFLASANFPPVQYQLRLGRYFPNNLPLRPSPFLHWTPTDFQLFLVFLATILHLQMPTTLISMGPFLYLSHLDHSDARKLKSFELKVSKVLRPLPSLASSRIRPKSTSTFSGPSNLSNSSTLTFTLKTSFQILSGSCKYCSLSRIPSSAFSFVTSCSLSKEVCDFYIGVGGVILLLVIGSVFPREPSSLTAYLYNKMHAFWRKEKNCGSTNSHSEQPGGNITKLGDHRRRGNKHISHIRHHTHQRRKKKFTIRRVLKLQGVHPR